jgi:hypothetical protein
MKKIKSIIVFVFCGYTSMYTMEIHEYIERNKNSPVALAKILSDMAQWETPDLEIANTIFDLGVAMQLGNLVDGSGGTAALIPAAAHQKMEYLKPLLSYGANIESKCPRDGRTALINAAIYRCNDAVALLLERGANPNATDNDNKTALTYARESFFSEYQKQYDDIVQLLQSAGAKG